MADRPGRLRQLVIDAVGSYRAIELKARAGRLAPIARQHLLERREVRRLRRELDKRPTAKVVTIIPTYRRPELLRRAVQSALGQSEQDHVVVVVDDGGGQLADIEDQRLVQVSLSANSGVVGTVRNVGIAITDSRYCAFLDDDNTWKPDHLARAVAALEAGADLVYSGIERVDVLGRTTGTVSEPFDRPRLRRTNFVDASAMTLRRGPWCRWSRMPRGFGAVTAEDWELTWRVSRRHPVAHVAEATVVYLVHEGSYYTDR